VSLNSYVEDACLFVMQCILFYLYYDLVYIPVLGYKAVGCNLQSLAVFKYTYVLLISNMSPAEFIVHAPTCLWRWNRQSVP